MGWISDVLTLLILGTCGYRGYQRGAYQSTLSLLGHGGGIAAAYFLAKPVGVFLAAHNIVSQRHSQMTGGLTLFCGVLLLVGAYSSTETMLSPRKEVLTRPLRAGGAVLATLPGFMYAALAAIMVLFLRSGSKDFRPSFTEKTFAGGAARIMQSTFQDPKNGKHPAIKAVYRVVSDPALRKS